MRAALLSLLVFAVTAMHGYGSDIKFPAHEIPDSLLKHANVVVRHDARTFRINARDRATYHVYSAITILNEQGKSFAREVIVYDKLSKIKKINGTVYDATGKLIKTLKASEIYDQSAYDGMTLFSDNRLKAVDLTHGSYPYTVEFEYELELKYLFYIPSFVLQPEEKMSVQSASFILEYPIALKPKYDAIGINQSPQIRHSPDGTELVIWEFRNIMPVIDEPHSPGRHALSPRIMAAPSYFEYASYVGSMNTWNEFGKWIAKLNEGRDELPAATKQQILAMTADQKTIEDKTRVLYEYLQSKTRYVGIQLGIGGYQPFEASIVDEFGYGDCKALSNYMVSMLKVIGIKSHYALINAGPSAPPLKANFVSSQFNHAVVAVPNGGDTLWLECTSQTNPFGYAGRFTGDRKALLITDAGAQIANTPNYAAEQNVQFSSAKVTLDKTGNGKAKVSTIYGGLQYENNRLNSILNDPRDEQKQWIQKNIKIPSFDLIAFSLSNLKDRLPSATIDLELNLTRLANISGKRMFLTPNLLNRSTYTPNPVEKRTTIVLQRIGFLDVDTIRYTLPEEVYPEFLPGPIKIKSTFGEYEATFQVEQGNLTYIRRLKMYKGEFPPSSYQELIDFHRSVIKADNTRMVFMTKT